MAGNDNYTFPILGELIRFASRALTYSSEANVKAPTVLIATTTGGADGAKTGADVPFPTQLGDQGGFKTQELADATDALVGALSESAPASDTAPVGLNGRMQRLAQRITSLMAMLDAKSRSDTFASNVTSVEAVGGILDLSTLGAADKWTLQVHQTGTITSWTVDLRVSLYNGNYKTILTHRKTADDADPATVVGDGELAFVDGRVARYGQVVVRELTKGAGTSITAYIGAK